MSPLIGERTTGSSPGGGRVLVVALLASTGVGLVAAYATRKDALPSAPPKGPRVADSTPGAAKRVLPSPPRVPALVPPDAETSVSGSVELQPGRKGYDPARLAKVVPLESLFGQEPRNGAWAAPVEEALPGLVLADTDRLLPGLKIVAVSCRTTVCRIEWSGPEEVGKLAEEVMRILLPGAVSKTRSPYHYVAFSGGRWLYRNVPAGNVQETLSVTRQARERMMAWVRRGTMTPMPAGIPPEAWPTR